MALLDFQTALGRLLRTGDTAGLHGLTLETREVEYLEALQETRGFQFCKSIQRSWCIGRAAKSAHLTLSFLDEGERQVLLDEWIDSGAGTGSFYDAEAASFLDFLARRLPNPSHQLSVCQLERATLIAGEGMESFIAPDTTALSNGDCRLQRGRFAALVQFSVDPERLLQSLRNHEPLPPLPNEVTELLFAPGVERLCYIASAEEKEIWDYLEAPQPARALRNNLDHQEGTLKQLLRSGVIEYAG